MIGFITSNLTYTYNLKVMSKYTVTYYCSKDKGSIGNVDNILRMGDVAIAEFNPKKLGKGKAQFTYVVFLGRTFRVADEFDISNNVEIYQGVKGKCNCSADSPYYIARNKQGGGYLLKFLYTKTETYEDQDH